MAKQTGFEFSGSMGGVTFYQMNGQGYARQKKQSDKKRFHQKGRYEGTKRMNEEFAQASRLSAAFRYALAPMLHGINTGYLPSRLTALFRKVIATDPVHGLGERNLFHGDIEMLEGMEMAHSQRLDHQLPWMPKVQVFPESQTVKLDFTKTGTFNKESFPEGATHYRLVPALVLLAEDTLSDTNRHIDEGLDFIPIGEDMAKLGTITLEYTASPAERLLHVLLGIYCYQEVNGEYHPLLGSGAIRILKVVRIGSGGKVTGAEK